MVRPGHLSQRMKQGQGVRAYAGVHEGGRAHFQSRPRHHGGLVATAAVVMLCRRRRRCHHGRGHRIVVVSSSWSDHGWDARKSVSKEAPGSRLGEHGELRRNVINEKKKTTCADPSSRAAEGLHSTVQLLRPSLSLDRRCHFPWIHRRELGPEHFHLENVSP